MSAKESASAEKPKSRVWMLVLGLVCLGLFGYAAFKPTVEGDIAYGVGFYLIPAGVVALAFCAVASGARALQWRVFAFIYGSLIAGHVLGVQTQEQRARQMADNLKQAYANFAEQTAFEPGEMPKPLTVQPATSNLEGDHGVTEVLGKTMLNDLAAVQNEYLKALEGVGWMTLLDANRLRQDTGMRESRAIITAAEAVVREYRAKTFAVVESLPERVQRAPFSSDAVRREFLRGAAEGAATGRRSATASWDYEQQILLECQAVIDFLAKRQGLYEFKDGQVLFEEQSDADVYNAHTAKVNELIQEQSQLAKRASAEALEKLDASRR